MSDTVNEKIERGGKDKDILLAAYREVCHSYHAVDDFRANLLALLPIASGTGGILLLANKDTFATYLGPIGLFGLIVTIGLLFYELRGLNQCGKLIEEGKQLEKDLYLEHGLFLVKPEEKVFGFIGATAAGLTVYLSVILGWVYVAFVGYKGICIS